MGLLDVTPELIRQYAAESNVSVVSNDTLEVDAETGSVLFACPIGVLALHEGIKHGFEGETVELIDAVEVAAGAGWISREEFRQGSYLCFVQGFDAHTDVHNYCYREVHLYQSGRPGLLGLPCKYFTHGRAMAVALIPGEEVSA